ncbi:MAG: CHASE domain-containing protein [Actinobacteria bacterium]|nr:CHASE domain-containing protein [Actinomycetota bacterium]
MAIVVAIGLIVSASASMWLWNAEQQRARRALDGSTEVLAGSITNAISDAIDRLAAVGGLFESSEDVTRDEFRRFVENLGSLSGLEGLGYMPLISGEDLDAFTAEIRESIPDYTVFEVDRSGERIPVGERSEYAPAQWFEPFDAFGRPHGFDSLSEPNRAAGIETARRTGEVAATPFLQLVSEEDVDGFLLYWPVTDPATQEVVGFVLAAMDLSELLDSQIPVTLTNQVDWSVTDATTRPQDEVAAEGNSVASLEVGSRQWQLLITPKPSSDLVANRTLPVLVFAGGAFLSVLAAYALSLYRQRKRNGLELKILSELSQARDQFLASVSHELRTPLTAVVGFSQILRDSRNVLSDDERLSMISSIADEAADLSHIIDDLLVEARTELNSFAVTSVPVDVRAQVSQVLETTPTDTRTRVEILANPEVSYRADGDPERVRQILRNLISNATRYGGDQIQVRLIVTVEKVQIQVADNGQGLPPEEWEKIFEPYYRSHHTSTQPAAVGIGLSVARQLAQLMDGDLTHRREDHWSVFELELPVAASPGQATPEPQQSSVT